jgi:hypothetical protein
MNLSPEDIELRKNADRLNCRPEDVLLASGDGFWRRRTGRTVKQQQAVEHMERSLRARAAETAEEREARQDRIHRRAEAKRGRAAQELETILEQQQRFAEEERAREDAVYAANQDRAQRRLIAKLKEIREPMADTRITEKAPPVERDLHFPALTMPRGHMLKPHQRKPSVWESRVTYEQGVL